MSCRYRLAKTHLSRPLPELRQQRLNLQIKLLLVMLWGCTMVALTPITTMGNQRD